MVWSKGCPRCRGDLMRMEDEYEPYLSCLQCGNTVYGTTDAPPEDGEPEPGLVAMALRALNASAAEDERASA